LLFRSTIAIQAGIKRQKVRYPWYVGGTEPGEWFNVTVDVAKSGTYAADFLYTSNRGGTISVDVNGKDATGSLQIATTNDPADPLAWRQWHHWNLAYFDFKPVRRWRFNSM
jgi:hypothetical protein